MHRQAYVLLVLTALFWSGNVVAGKLAVGHVSPVFLTLARWGLTTALLLVIGWRPIMRDWPVLRRHLPLLLTLGAVGFALFNIALYTAVLYTSALNVMIEQAGMPMLIVAANFLLFSQRIGYGQVIGFVLTMVGIVLTASHGELARLLALDLNVGDAIMLGGCVFYAGFTVCLRYKPDISWQSLMVAMSAGAMLISIPFAGWEMARGAMILPDTTGWTIILYTVLFPSLMAQVFYMRGVEMIGGNRAGLFINLVPVLGAILSIFILGEDFQPYHAVAMALVLGGITLAETTGRRLEARRTEDTR